VSFSLEDPPKGTALYLAQFRGEEMRADGADLVSISVDADRKPRTPPQVEVANARLECRSSKGVTPLACCRVGGYLAMSALDHAPMFRPSIAGRRCESASVIKTKRQSVPRVFCMDYVIAGRCATSTAKAKGPCKCTKACLDEHNCCENYLFDDP